MRKEPKPKQVSKYMTITKYKGDYPGLDKPTVEERVAAIERNNGKIYRFYPYETGSGENGVCLSYGILTKMWNGEGWCDTGATTGFTYEKYEAERFAWKCNREHIDSSQLVNELIDFEKDEIPVKKLMLDMRMKEKKTFEKVKCPALKGKG